MNNDIKNGKNSASENLMQLMSYTIDKTVEMADANSVLGDRIEIDGMTVIPVSKVSAGFAGGGANIVNVTAKKSNTPSGSGAKVTVTPMSFLVISNGKVSAVSVEESEKESKEGLVKKIADAVRSIKKNKNESTSEAEEN